MDEKERNKAVTTEEAIRSLVKGEEAEYDPDRFIDLIIDLIAEQSEEKAEERIDQHERDYDHNNWG